MRELGLLLKPSPYSSMASLYGSLGNRDKVDEILREMKESNVRLDSLTVNSALRAYAAVSDIAAMEKFLADSKATPTIAWVTRIDMARAYLRDGSKEKAREMLRRTEKLKDPDSCEDIMKLYGEAGKSEDVYRIWKLYKKSREQSNEGFLALIESLLKLDDVKGAEEIYHNEWECSGLELDLRIPTLLASAYRKKGMANNAYGLMSKTMRNRAFAGPITPLLEEWGKGGNQSDLRDLIRSLRDSNQFSKALEASTWMGEKKLINLFPEEYASRLHLIEKVLGLEEAERFFEKSIPEEMKDQSVYAALLISYTRCGKTLDKAEATFEKMRDLGFLSRPSPFNSMISLYGQLGWPSKVKKLVKRMEEEKIEPDSVTMNNILRVYADETDIETMEEYKVDAEKKKTKLEARTMAAMGKAYEREGLMQNAIETVPGKEEVHRLWDEYKKEGEIWDEGYQSVISSLLKLDDVDGAERIYGEWQSKGRELDARIPGLLISRYCQDNDYMKVRKVLDSARKSCKRMRIEEPTILSLESVATLSVIPLALLWNRFFCSYTNGALSSPATNHTLQSRIEAASDRKTAITTVLEQWRRQQKGKQINPSLVRVIVEELRDCQRFRQALERRSSSRASRGRSESVYTALLSSYTKSGKKYLYKAEATFQKMRELGLLLKPLPYNSMTSLYSSIGNRDKVDEFLREMSENNVRFDSLTVNNALRVYAAVSDIATMEEFLGDWEAIVKLEWLTTLEMAKAYLRDDSEEKARELLRRTEEMMDPESYEELMKLYGEVGEREDVYRIWGMYKISEKQDNEGFRALIGSLLKLGDINGAEEIYYNEWEYSGLEFDVRIPTMLASGYREEGMVKKADKLMSKTINNRSLVRPISPLLDEWSRRVNRVKPSDMRGLINDLCDSKQYPKALEASTWMGEKILFDLFPEDYAARLHLIDNVLGLEEAERFFESSIPEKMKNYSVYSTLLASYTRSAKTLGKAEATFEKMSELGFLSKLSPFKSMISLYSELRKRSRVMKLVEKMKEKNIEPDSVTMNNVLRVNADVSAIESMERCKRECEDGRNKLRLEVRTMDAMAKAYETAGLTLKVIQSTGSKNEVYRLWNEYKKDNIGNMGNEEYLSVIRSLLKLVDVKGAQEIYDEWEPKGYEFDSRIPSLLLSRYCEEEYNEVKAREVVKSMRKKRRLLQFEVFKDVSIVVMGTSLGAGFVPGTLWICGGEPSTLWVSLGLVIVAIAYAFTNGGRSI
ncbi:unnamed protein product [Thlaspi arvense]|uniref:Pentatricopeptide repeat-containing protein n=1 Tax=Thlaspi arvense TaxID=13288 RepID=A0AAU9RZJ7_THLAR|nr:unnamed protein product [Thlaspi arvense]